MIINFLADASGLIKDSTSKACTTACNLTTVPELAAKVTSAIVYLVGALSIIMIVVGGIRYVISNGDPKKVADAKNTITYAIVGIVVALLAYAIVTFVTKSLT